MDDTSSAHTPPAAAPVRVSCICQIHISNMNVRKNQHELRISKAVQPWAFSCHLFRYQYRYSQDICTPPLCPAGFYFQFLLENVLLSRTNFQQISVKKSVPLFLTRRCCLDFWFSGFLRFCYNEKHLCIFSSKS